MACASTDIWSGIRAITSIGSWRGRARTAARKQRRAVSHRRGLRPQSGILYRRDRHGDEARRDAASRWSAIKFGLPLTCLNHDFIAAGSDTQYVSTLTIGTDLPGLRRLLNPLIHRFLFTEAMGHAWMKHNIEEVGLLEHMLPRALSGLKRCASCALRLCADRTGCGAFASITCAPRTIPPAVARSQTAMLSNRQNLGLLLGVLGVAVFAGSLPASRIAVSEVSPFFLTAMRATLAGFGGLTMLLVTRRKFPPRDAWWPLAAVVISIALGFPLLSAMAMVTVPSSHGGVILGIMPLATTAAAAVIQGERPSAGFWIAAVIGSALIMAFAMYQGGGFSLSAGDLLLLVAVVCGGIGYTYSGQLSAFMPGWEVISWVMVIALPLSLVALYFTWPADAGAISPRVWTAILYAGLMAQFVGFFLVECRDGDGRHFAHRPDRAAAAGLRGLVRRRLRARAARSDHADLRRRRGRDGCDRHAAARAPRLARRNRFVETFTPPPAAPPLPRHAAATECDAPGCHRHRHGCRPATRSCRDRSRAAAPRTRPCPRGKRS